MDHNKNTLKQLKQSAETLKKQFARLHRQELFKQGENSPYTETASALGDAYSNIHAVEAIKANLEAAIRWYQVAYNNGDQNAAYKLAESFYQKFSQYTGSKRDLNKALDLLMQKELGTQEIKLSTELEAEKYYREGNKEWKNGNKDNALSQYKKAASLKHAIALKKLIELSTNKDGYMSHQDWMQLNYDLGYIYSTRLCQQNITEIMQLLAKLADNNELDDVSKQKLLLRKFRLYQKNIKQIKKAIRHYQHAFHIARKDLNSEQAQQITDQVLKELEKITINDPKWYIHDHGIPNELELFLQETLGFAQLIFNRLRNAPNLLPSSQEKNEAPAY